MKIFFSSDHHFFHSNIIKYCSRPFADVDSMNAEMAQRWNDVVGKEDLVIYVGDMTAGLRGRISEFSELISSLHGKKILIRGNHDHQTDEWYRQAGFISVVESINLGGVLLVHYSLKEALSRNLDSSKWGEVEHVIHGHTHTVDTPNHENHFNVAADRNDYRPVTCEVAVPQNLHASFAAALESFILQEYISA